MVGHEPFAILEEIVCVGFVEIVPGSTIQRSLNLEDANERTNVLQVSRYTLVSLQLEPDCSSASPKLLR